MYTFVVDDNHPPGSATIVAKKLQNMEHTIIHGLQDFSARIQGFTNVPYMSLRQETPPGTSQTHEQRADAETSPGLAAVEPSDCYKPIETI